MKFASVISFFFSAHTCAMAHVWRSEDNFAGVSSLPLLLGWACAVSSFYSHKTTSLALISSFFLTQEEQRLGYRELGYTQGASLSCGGLFFWPLVMN